MTDRKTSCPYRTDKCLSQDLTLSRHTDHQRAARGRKERERYEVKEDQLFGDFRAFGQTAFVDASSRSTNGRRGAEKAHRAPVGCKVLGCLRKTAEKKGLPYQSLINETLAGEMRKAS
jgi:hypothetical protein